MKSKQDLRVFEPHQSKRFPHHTRRCLVCKQHFNRHEAICSFCGTCQRCETLNADKFGNHCIHCNNSIDQLRYDEQASMMTIVHQPVHFLDTLEPKEPRRLQ